MKKILIAERYPLLKEALRATIENEPGLSVEGVVDSLSQLEQTLERKPDILLLDTQFDHANTELLYDRIHARYPNISILLFSFEVDLKQIRRAFKSGISGFLLKSVSKDQLIEAIRHIFEGGIYIHEPIRNAMVNSALSGVPKKKINIQLTQREQEVLRLIIEEYTSKEIAEKLYISHCTVETHRINLIQKLGVKNTAGLVREAIQLQLCPQV